MLRASYLFDRMGTKTSAFHMQIEGEDVQGNPKLAVFELTAKSGHGLRIPCAAAIILTHKIVSNELSLRGATPCVGLITLDEYLEALSQFDIKWRIAG